MSLSTILLIPAIVLIILVFVVLFLLAPILVLKLGLDDWREGNKVPALIQFMLFLIMIMFYVGLILSLFGL